MKKILKIVLILFGVLLAIGIIGSIIDEKEKVSNAENTKVISTENKNSGLIPSKNEDTKNQLEQVLNIKKIDEILIAKGFKKTYSEYEDIKNIRYIKEINKFDIEVIIASKVIDKKNYFHDLSIYSRHFHTKPSNEEIKLNLDTFSKIINDQILVPDLQAIITTATNKLPIEVPKYKAGNLDDVQKLYNYYNIKEYSITTYNGKTEKSITIEAH
ncbi:hypothetical protein [Fusobacterium gastrosuis]|uniref:hypothetical protein n=1 Tax=Fusobacterium gastrosuis TaxID=1755100 RepID=UPI002978B1FF|nr:hypothetical protein [Fusobacteriaceae bacterium]MDY5713660.1 hypothetical protein [Fusobacterium gastrosuis]